MASSQQTVLSHREVLLDWLSVNPTPLLRWLMDAGVLDHDQFRMVLERSPANRVANVLEHVCSSEKNSAKFLQVLQQVQGFYSTQLQDWVTQHCGQTSVETPPKSTQDTGEGTLTNTTQHCSQTSTRTTPTTQYIGEHLQRKSKPKSPLSKLFGKNKFTLPKDKVDNQVSQKKLKSSGFRAQKSWILKEDFLSHIQLFSSPSPSLSLYAAAVNAHKSTVLHQTERLVSYSEGGEQDTSSHAHIDIRYTELFVTEDEEQPSDGQHEYFALASRRSPIYPHHICRFIHPRDLLNPNPHTGCSPQRVKVKGIAGIGKSVAMQRIMYEWALGKHLQNFTCVFDLRFRELSLIDGPISLRELLASRFLHLQYVLSDLFEDSRSLLFILDGLDEFRHHLDWYCEDLMLTVESQVSVSKLLVSLIKGNLLPKSSVILTTRPSTDAPKRLFPRCCVVLGFQEKHVEEYTMKFYKDPQVAKKVYNYIEKNDSLFALSFIPLYCYIICSALAEFFSSGHNNKQSLDINPPRTVSEVYYCYLYTTIKHHALKDKAETANLPRSRVLALVKAQLVNLGRLAYENLLRNRILFDQKDLEKFSLNPTGIRSTFLSQILVSLKEKKEMFAFFHLTIQEYLAALFCVVNLTGHAEILSGLDYWCFGELRSPAKSPPFTLNFLPAGDDLERPRVENLQMFTRFFSGLLRARLARLLDGMLEFRLEADDGPMALSSLLGDWFRSQFMSRNLPNQTALNLLHCLMELHMQETTSRAAPEIRKLNLFKMKLSVVDCTAVNYVLKFSEHSLEELNLGYSNIGNRGLSRLGPILHRCKSLYLRYNCLGTDAAILESAVLRSEDCQVKKLFMCGNKLGPEGARALWAALEHNKTVEEVYLDITGITESGTENMVQCLRKSTALKSLTVVGNDLGEAGWARLAELRQVRSDLRVIGHFVDDLALMEAYLGWVEEMRSDRDQLDSVKNADALHSVLIGLRLREGSGLNAVKAKELETKIMELLNHSEKSTLRTI
ncbi:NLR family CARD domain-containing protein 3-like [Hoplias malabaricus]|uniref:NLR family CARD domain-containing protein 3-like n=1 Tax=Hoplias malabaricus TaxID=27720 RepID=UPI003461E198